MTTFRLLALAGLVLALGAGSEATAQTKTLKLGYALSATSHYGQGANAFAAEIEKQSQGRFKIEQFPASALGGEREMVEGAQLGTVDLVITSTGPVGNFVPETLITDIPFLFRDYAHARGVLDGPDDEVGRAGGARHHGHLPGRVEREDHAVGEHLAHLIPVDGGGRDRGHSAGVDGEETGATGRDDGDVRREVGPRPIE